MTSVILNERIWSRTGPASANSAGHYADGNGVTLVLDRIGYDKHLHDILTSEERTRQYYRDFFAQQGIGLVECDLTRLDQLPCAKTIGKKIEAGRPSVYIASLALPLADQSFILSIYAREAGVSGLRETTVLEQLVGAGRRFPADERTGKIVGWADDPYLPGYQGPCLRNLSESAEYDAQFPQHPLSKVRHRIEELAADTRIGGLSRKHWWKFW